MVVIRGRLTPEAGAVLMQALEAAREALYRRTRDAMEAVGPDVSAEMSRRLACDATRVVMRHDGEARVVDVGARTRTIPPSIRRALHHRDRGCRFPGCGVSFGQGHHIRHWAPGGPATLSNLTLLCHRHHPAIREEGYQVERQPDGELRFRTPQGRLIPAVPAAPAISDDPMRALRARNERAGLHLKADTLRPIWLGETLDVGYAIDVLHPRALQPLSRPDEAASREMHAERFGA
jgi:hypothetical protein